MEQIVIVGAGRAGAYAAATLRQEGFTGRIFLVGEEPVPPYDRPPLSKAVLLGKATPIDGLIFKREFYGENTIDLCLGDPAIRLDVALRQIELRSGQSLKYDKLLLATGSRPRKLTWDADSVSRLHYLRTAADAEAIAQLLKASRRVANTGYFRRTEAIVLASETQPNCTRRFSDSRDSGQTARVVRAGAEDRPLAAYNAKG